MSTETEDRYLIFKVGGELLAAPLLSISEIVEPLAFRSVPNPNDYFLGLSNLRGQLVGVVDLGKRFGLEPVSTTKEGVFLIFEVEGTMMAGLASSVETVAEIPASAIVRECDAEVKIPREAFRGIAKSDNHLMPIVHLPDIVKAQNL